MVLGDHDQPLKAGVLEKLDIGVRLDLFIQGKDRRIDLAWRPLLTVKGVDAEVEERRQLRLLIAVLVRRRRCAERRNVRNGSVAQVAVTQPAALCDRDGIFLCAHAVLRRDRVGHRAGEVLRALRRIARALGDHDRRCQRRQLVLIGADTDRARVMVDRAVAAADAERLDARDGGAVVDLKLTEARLLGGIADAVGIDAQVFCRDRVVEGDRRLAVHRVERRLRRQVEPVHGGIVGRVEAHVLCPPGKRLHQRHRVKRSRLVPRDLHPQRRRIVVRCRPTRASVAVVQLICIICAAAGAVLRAGGSRAGIVRTAGERQIVVRVSSCGRSRCAVHLTQEYLQLRQPGHISFLRRERDPQPPRRNVCLILVLGKLPLSADDRLRCEQLPVVAVLSAGGLQLHPLDAREPFIEHHCVKGLLGVPFERDGDVVRLVIRAPAAVVAGHIDPRVKQILRRELRVLGACGDLRPARKVSLYRPIDLQLGNADLICTGALFPELQQQMPRAAALVQTDRAILADGGTLTVLLCLLINLVPLDGCIEPIRGGFILDSLYAVGNVDLKFLRALGVFADAQRVKGLQRFPAQRQPDHVRAVVFV